MFPEGTGLLPGSESRRLGLPWLGSAKMLVMQSFCKQAVLLAALEVPTVSSASWNLPGGGCLPSGPGDCVSDLLESTVFKEGDFTMWVEGGPSVLQKTLGTFTEGIMGLVYQDSGPLVSSGSPVFGFPKPESPPWISAPGVCDRRRLSGEQFLKR